MRVLQINVSPSGGLPKLPVEKVFVKKTGLEGDYNKYRMTKLNGDPTSAVLLLPHVTILSYAKRGYKVGPGSMGENFTLESVSYEELTIGRRLALGREVRLNIERTCEPCDELLVYGDDFVKVTQGKRGMYCSVEREGTVFGGDECSFFD